MRTDRRVCPALTDARSASGLTSYLVISCPVPARLLEVKQEGQGSLSLLSSNQIYPQGKTTLCQEWCSLRHPSKQDRQAS